MRSFGVTAMLMSPGSSRAVASTWLLKSERMRWTVSEPIATANAHRIENVNSAEAPASFARIGSRSNAADRRVPAR